MAAALLASYGIHVAEDTSPLVTVALAAAVYVCVHGIALWRELQRKRGETDNSGS